MVELRNESLYLAIDPLGAEIRRAECDGRSVIWEGDGTFWKGSAPVLFPICSGLAEDHYLYKGKRYSMPKHGFAKTTVFSVEEQGADHATFLLSSAEHPREDYPFSYELRVSYRLVDRTVLVDYHVTNCSDTETLYFSIGAHEGYTCPQGLSGYTVRFDRPETLRAYQLEGPLLSDRFEELGRDVTELPLSDAHFAIDALIFKDLTSRRLWLETQDGSSRIRVEYEGFPYLLIWSRPGAPFVCIEPWCGITDPVGPVRDIAKKPGIISLPPCGTTTRTHSFTVEI